MLPLRDTVRSNTFPVVNWLIIALNALVFMFELSLPPAQLDRLIYAFGVVPARLQINTPLYLLGHPLALLPLFTSMFLHGGWLHILGNMWVLYIFGDNIEDRMGSGRYLLFYLFSGLVAGLAQVFIDPSSRIPSIGASGAIAGVLGAYLFMFPRSRVITLIPLFFIPWFIEIPAVIFLVAWFGLQLFSGLSTLGVQHTAAVGGIAFWAHIGGFIFGMLFYRLFVPRRPPAYTRNFPDQYYPY